MGCPQGMRKSTKGGCVDANEDKLKKLFDSRRKKVTSPRGDRIIQNDWGSCRYNGYWHPSMSFATDPITGGPITMRVLASYCEDINNMSVPDHYNHCTYIYRVPDSNKYEEVCFWDWWDRMDTPHEEH